MRGGCSRQRQQGVVQEGMALTWFYLFIYLLYSGIREKMKEPTEKLLDGKEIRMKDMRVAGYRNVSTQKVMYSDVSLPTTVKAAALGNLGTLDQ